MTLSANIATSVGIAAGGAFVFYVFTRVRARRGESTNTVKAEEILKKARLEAEAIIREARLAASEEISSLRNDMEKSFAARREERIESEKRLAERERLINAQLAKIVETEGSLKDQQELVRQQSLDLEKRASDVAQLARQSHDYLQRIAGMTEAEARAELAKKIETGAAKESAETTRRILEDARLRAEEKARQIISTAIQRYAGTHTVANTTASIPLQGDEIKGRIIGREGRNIRAFESATGVTVLIDDTPGSILLSGFDPVRREVGREAMVRLIADGRIHPTRIEEIVEQVKKEMDLTITRLGEQAVARANLPPMHPDIVNLLGRLHFRHSFSQNVLDHSVEVAHLMGLMASEMGLDVTSAKRAGLFHDIGKAVSHEIEGPHAVVGAEIIKRYGESEAVVNGVASHHNDVPPAGPLGVLVSAADAISAARPGARSESMTTYLKRVEDLEKLAASFPGVEKAFAIQAGRELRVMVQPDQINDDQAFALARDIAAKIQEELQYPGEIRVTVIREKRCVEVAK
jgi:ribonuclease Y